MQILCQVPLVVVDQPAAGEFGNGM